jgi:salicylate 5-hydroxylase large subunit
MSALTENSADHVPPPWVSTPWPDASRATVPYWIYTNEQVLERERERIFARSWNYVGLTAELDRPGSFIRSFCGDIPIIVTRDTDDTIACVVNRCGHRGVEFCQDMRGEARKLTCPYHQWTYTLQGKLTGIPFRRGNHGSGGMPSDFDPAERNLQRLHVAVRNGAIFAAVDPTEPDVQSWLGPEMTSWFDRTLDGRELRVLGKHRQRVGGNWKLYAENLRDPYHGPILHVFFTTFGLARADQPGGVKTDELGRHAVLFHYRTEDQAGASADLRSYRAGFTLADTRILERRQERTGASTAMQAIWPNLVIGTQNNSLNMRQIVPRGAHEFDLVWTFFGYADDDPDMTAHRIRQAALQGPAGYISIDDSEMFVENHSGIAIDPREHAVIEMGGRGTGDADTVITETAIRSFYHHYRRVMEF